jgi:hypothetical protein
MQSCIIFMSMPCIIIGMLSIISAVMFTGNSSDLWLVRRRLRRLYYELLRGAVALGKRTPPTKDSSNFTAPVLAASKRCRVAVVTFLYLAHRIVPFVVAPKLIHHE